MTSARAVAERRPVTRRDRERPPGPAVRPAGSDVELSIQQLDRITIQAPTEERAGQLLDDALAEPARGLPYLAALQDRFGQRLDWVQVRSGPLVTEALDALGAQAATRGSDVFLRAPSAPIDVVTHEVTHALQARLGGPGPGGVVVGENAAPEVEAVQVLRAPVRPAEGLAPGAIALLLQGRPASTDPVITVQPMPAPSGVAPPVAASGAAVPGPIGPAPGIDASAGPAGGATDEPAAAFVLPAPSELAVSAEEVAARESAIAEAEAGLAGAGSARDLLDAYVSAPPTVKARQAASLSGALEAVLPAETQEWQSAVPPIEATLTGAAGPPPEPLRVGSPPAAEVQLEPVAVAPAPEPAIAEVPEALPFTANDGVNRAFGRLTAPPPEQLADAIGATLGAVQTSDPSLPRSPGPPPPIPLGGETDPARMAGQADAVGMQASAARDAAARAVAEGPGPEQVRPTSLHESFAVETAEAPAAPALAVPEGPGAYLALGLPPEVQVTFDEQQQGAMQESMAAATAKADEATTARDAARDQAVVTAQQAAAALNTTARADQTAAVGDGRTAIQTERQSAIEAQQAEVGRIRGEAAGRRRVDKGAIDSQVQVEQKALDDSYAAAESQITTTVADGERQAQEQRAQAQRDAEAESWWDQTVSFVEEAFNALVSAIGKVFDAVRAAVNAALDALKQFALSVIDRLATFVKDVIAAYGEFLKFAMDTLLGEFFPELAAQLNAAIDTAVAAAQAAVDGVADRLKAGISALVEGLRAGINAALDAYEAAISFAVSVVGAALTGDWGLVARKVLEAVLKLVGVDPEAFYAFVGRAQQTFDIIVNDPLGFLSNLVSALVGGVQGFADRFGEHLKKGLIGWLTGTLGGAGITLPQTFDLMGVLDLARQVLGLTWERIRAKAVKLIGQQNVARLEFIGDYITTLVNEGWSGLWTKVKADLSSLLDMVFGGIRSFLVERVVLAAIKKIPALFGPVGAIVQLVMTAWNLYEFLRDQLARIGALVQTVVDSIGDIARGMLTGAVAKVEGVLGNLVPIALDLLARLLGLGNVGEDVRKVIEKVQAFIDKAIDGLITRVIGLFTGKGRGGTAAGEPADADAAVPIGSDAPLEDTITIAGEEHTLRAVGPSGDATLEMASGPFDKLVSRMNKLVKELKKTYTTPGKPHYLGDAAAAAANAGLDALAATAQSLVTNIGKETDKKKEEKLVTAGFSELRKQIAALRLPTASTTALHARHEVQAGQVLSYGRQTWFEVNPLVPESTTKGGKPSGPVPGVKVLKDYQQGHLVAKSLGGPGTEDNLVAMAKQTNITRVGVVGVEDSLRYALGKFLTDYPEAAPGYIFSYRVTANYRPDGGLQADLASHHVAKADSEPQLFALAEAATSQRPTDAAIRATVLPAPTLAEDAKLAENVRRRLVWFFTPASISADTQVLRAPESFSAKIYQSATAPNHLGIDLTWVS
jgi:phage-related protein